MASGALSSWLEVAFRAPTASLRYRVYCRAFAVASGVHLLLPDALDETWLVPNVAYWVGAGLLAYSGGLAGWLLAAFGLAVPLFSLGDQLTQSVYLLACTLAALTCFVGPRKSLDARLAGSLPSAVAVLTIGVYAIAAFHKLNRDFFDPAVSCANGGLAILADNWAIGGGPGTFGSPGWPILFLVAETTVVLLLVLRPVFGMLVAVLMHIPLTIVFAPSFAFVMVSGWVCLLREDEARHFLATLRARWPVIVGVGAAFGLASFGLYMVRHWVVYPWWSFKEALLWMLFVWLLVGERTRSEALPRRRAISPTSRHARVIAIVVGVLWTLNGLTPYTGLRFHQSGAMLSNLRIDTGCWNSALIPEAVRIRDPYIRIDEAEVGGDVPGPEALEETLRDTLWNRRSLERLRRSACEQGAGPITIWGADDERELEGVDLCESPWAFGRPLLSGARPFQENLSRQCPQACIH